MSKIIKGDGSDCFDPTLLDMGTRRSIIPREELLATEIGREILTRAQEEAARIREKADQTLIKAVQERQEERKRGFEDGFQEGLAQLTEKLAQAEADREKLLREQEAELVQMVKEIAEKVVARELKKGAIADIVRRALSQALGERVVLRIHPGDREKLTEEFGPTLKIQEDESLTPGGCVVETELGTVDAKLETQWVAIKKALGLGEKE